MDWVTGGGPLDFRECSPSRMRSQFSTSCAGFLRYASSPTSNDDFRASGLRGAASDVLCMEERTVPCDLGVELAVADDRGLLFGVCSEGPERFSLEEGSGM